MPIRPENPLTTTDTQECPVIDPNEGLEPLPENDEGDGDKTPEN